MINNVLRRICLIVASTMLLGCLSGCAKQQPPEESTAPMATASQSAIDALDGKKVLFVGNSYTFWGYTVLVKWYEVLDQQTRSGDQGYFYQLCKAMGAEVSVTNWCFGAHDVTDMICEPCQRNLPCNGVVHHEYLTDRAFDYVVIQMYQERHYSGDINTHLQPVLDFFREANPNVKFLLVVPHMALEQDFVWVKDLEKLDRTNITVCNWGGMLYDIINGKTQVPGATQPYGRPTFVISASESDGHHQNPLVGYLTAAMVYSAITGESAVGLPYDFCDDSSIRSQFNLEQFKREHYVYEPYTNFVEVYRSAEDMRGLQQLVDQYLKNENP